MKILIFGDRGFTGTHLTKLLVDQGHEVLKGSAHVRSIGERDIVTSVLDDLKPEIVVNLAALSSVVGDNHEEMMSVNATALTGLLKASVSAKVRRFIHASSSQVYGPSGQNHVLETSELRPNTFYGITKVASELVCDLFASQLEVVISRPFSCIGPGQKEQFLVPKLVGAFARRDKSIEMGDISIAKDFVDIRDVCHFYSAAIATDKLSGTFNVCSGVATPLADLLSELSDITGHRPEIIRNSKFIRPNDINFQRGSRALSEKVLGWTPEIPIRETLTSMLRERQSV